MTAPRTILVIGATGHVGHVVVEEALARSLRVRAQSRNAARATTLLPADAEVVETSPTDAASLAGIIDGVDIVILTHGGDSDLENHYYAVLPALLDALAGRPEVHISLMTSMRISHPSGESWDWKRRAERLVRASGHPYTIVRPGWFDYQGAEDTQIDLRQGDLVERQPGVDRHHITQVLIEGALNTSGEHRTVEVFSRPGAPVTDFEKLFANTQPDTETGGVPSTRTSCQSEMSPPACRPISPASAPN